MKKKVAVVMNTMYVGGIEKVLVVLLNNLDYRRYDVDLWLRTTEGEMFSLINPNVTVKCWGLTDSRKDMIAKVRQGKARSPVGEDSGKLGGNPADDCSIAHGRAGGSHS